MAVEGEGRPTDEEIVRHHEAVRFALLRNEAELWEFGKWRDRWLRREEASQNVEPVSEAKMLEELDEELAGGGMQGKARELGEQGWRGVRRVRNDGNCFYRAFLFAYLEALMDASGEGAEEEARELGEELGRWKGRMKEEGYEEMVFESAREMLVAEVEGAAKGRRGTEEVRAKFSGWEDANEGAFLMMLLRLITSCEMRRNAGHYDNFLFGMPDGSNSVQSFCQKHVEPMGEEADHLHLTALTRALRIPLRVIYLSPASPISTNDFLPDCPLSTSPRVSLLYRPGHYDVLEASRP